mmetsp:Transcript_11079/g.18286  ORF Transcript_11079/g.18286 Transcript_11079/m.18286 type:complete len:464 (-) Transcript_11079:404-1795(-)
MKSGNKGFDFYRKIPVDLTESTAMGAFFSILAVLFMMILFFVELFAFLTTSWDTSVILDGTSDPKLRINFNITMMDVSCEYATIDVYDVLGTNKLNVTSNIEKWHLDDNGVRRMFMGRNKEQRDIMVEQHPYDLEQLHENGEHAIPVESREHWNQMLADKDFTFVDFYAPWCVWCQRLAPTWELFAEDVEGREDLKDRVNVVKVDCVEHREICQDHKIRSFPTLRFFVGDQPHMPDFKGDRTRNDLMKHLTEQVAQTGNLKTRLGDDQFQETLQRKQAMHDDHRSGCLLSGYLNVNRVPGNFHVEARSKYHDLDPTMTNVSHIVHHLSFGQPLSPQQQKSLGRVPEDLRNKMNPLDGNTYVNDAYHQAYHHYIKVVNTDFELRRPLSTHQMLATSQTMQYDEQTIPEAKFAYTLSPMGVVVKKGGRRWYDFVTSVCAIIGGTFTVIGVIDAVFYKLIKGKKQF